MTWALAVSREYLERAQCVARSRQDARALGVRICELMELEELEELRMLRTPPLCPTIATPPAAAASTSTRLRHMQRALRGGR